MMRLLSLFFLVFSIPSFSQVDVTFKVDMQYQIVSFDGIHLAGSMQGWNSESTPLSDNDGDNIWEVNLTLAQNSTHEFKFINGNSWGNDENVTGICGTTNGNRQLTVLNEDTILLAYVFNSCDYTEYGCIDENALNYNELANTDDGSCVFLDTTYGCTDNLACNFNINATQEDSSCVYPNYLSLKGIMDFSTPVGGNSGKAIHIVLTGNILDLSDYGIGVANNGGGTDGQEYTFPPISASSGDQILLARDTSAMSSYFDICYSQFDIILLAPSAISQNGDDAIELFHYGNVVETFGDINVDGTGTPWEYLDSWAYKDASGTVTFDSTNYWIFGGVNCTDNSTTTYVSGCPYPFCNIPLVNDCNGILGGPALTDGCGVCQLAYIYNFVTHVPTYVNDTSGLVLGPTEILVLPNDPTNPNWNSSCVWSAYGQK